MSVDLNAVHGTLRDVRPHAEVAFTGRLGAAVRELWGRVNQYTGRATAHHGAVYCEAFRGVDVGVLFVNVR